jgi:hypothetical protein
LLKLKTKGAVPASASTENEAEGDTEADVDVPELPPGIGTGVEFTEGVGPVEVAVEPTSAGNPSPPHATKTANNKITKKATDPLVKFLQH